MLLTTTENIAGKEYEILGLVKGATIQSKNIGKDFGAGLKSLIGGELTGYTDMMEEAREIATQRMIEDARRSGSKCHCGYAFFHKRYYARCGRSDGIWYSCENEITY